MVVLGYMHTRKTFYIVIVLLIALGAVFAFFDNAKAPESEITSYEECVAAGYPIMKSNPAQCRVSDGRTFTESALNQDSEGELCIQVITPARNPQTGEIVDFPTPCDVPEGWETIR
jgi:hypothetical protein